MPTGERQEDVVLAVFAIGLGVLSGHYNELLATRLHEARVQAFGPDGPARFKDAALSLHTGTTMQELAAALLDGGPAPTPHGVSKTLQ